MKSPRILIIEDQAPLASALGRVLARLSAVAELAPDGLEGLHKYAGGPFDLVITGLKVPKVNGVDVIRKIRATERGKDQAIIVMTGVYKGEEHRKRAREHLGVKYYLEKPFPQEAFLEAVRGALGIAAPASPAASPSPAKPAATPRPAAPPVPVSPATPPVPPSPPAVKMTPVPRSAPKPSATTTERAPAAPAKPRTELKPPPPPPPPAPPPPKPAPSAVANIQPRLALRGDLAKHSLAAVLLNAKEKRATGVMYLARSGHERKVLFVNGLPVGFQDSNPEYSLGGRLFRQGRISLLEYQAYQRDTRDGETPDELLMKMGCLSPAEYREEWRVRLEEGLIELFGWAEGEFTLQLWPALPENSPQPPVNLSHIIHQGFKRHLTPARREGFKGRAGAKFLARTGAFYDHWPLLAADAGEVRLMEAMDGSRRLTDLLGAAGAEAGSLLGSVAAFVSMGMVELRDAAGPGRMEASFPVRQGKAAGPQPEAAPAPEPEAMPAPAPEPEVEEEEKREGFDDLMGELDDSMGSVVDDLKEEDSVKPAPARDEGAEQAAREAELREFRDGLKGKNYYELFGMKPNKFDIGKLKEEYFKLTKKFSPEHYIMSSGEVLERAEETLSLLATGYNTLSNVVSKEKYDEVLAQKPAGVPGAKDHDKMQAEVAFQSGMAFLEMGDWDGAEKALSEAVSLAPDNAEMVAHYAYSLYNKNRKSKSIQKRVMELLSRSLKLNPRCAAAFAYRGAVLLEDDKAALAEADFNKALSLNPKYRFAQKGLKKIEARKQDEKKGLFGMFRK